MKLRGVTFEGAPVANERAFAKLPPLYADFLRTKNGLVAFDGGLHIRGVGKVPAWHALASVESGEHALSKLYPDTVRASDVPFGEDCIGDQFVLRGETVLRVSAETGDVESLAVGFDEFLARASKDPLEFLGMHPLVQFQRDGRRLEPGQVLHVWPPFCSAESAGGNVSFKAVPALEALAFHADLARQLRSLPPGAKFKVEIGD